MFKQILVTLLFALYQCAGDTDFSDPTSWPDICQQVGNQSPINIETQLVQQCTNERVKFTFFNGN